VVAVVPARADAEMKVDLRRCPDGHDGRQLAGAGDARRSRTRSRQGWLLCSGSDGSVSDAPPRNLSGPIRVRPGTDPADLAAYRPDVRGRRQAVARCAYIKPPSNDPSHPQATDPSDSARRRAGVPTRAPQRTKARRHEGRGRHDGKEGTP
jgi:hypothetical protein